MKVQECHQTISLANRTSRPERWGTWDEREESKEAAPVQVDIGVLFPAQTLPGHVTCTTHCSSEVR